MKEGSSSINHTHLRFIFLFLRNTPYICGWEEVTLIWFCSVTLSCQPRAEIFFKIVNILLISCYSHTLMITTQSLFIIVTCTTIIITIIIHFITLDVVVLLSVLVELMLSAVDVAPAPLCRPEPLHTLDTTALIKHVWSSSAPQLMNHVIIFRSPRCLIV